MPIFSPKFGLHVGLIEQSAKRMLSTHNQMSLQEAGNRTDVFQKAIQDEKRIRGPVLEAIPDEVRLVFMYHPTMAFSQLSRQSVKKIKDQDKQAGKEPKMGPVVESAVAVWPDATFSLWPMKDAPYQGIPPAEQIQAYVKSVFDRLLMEWERYHSAH